MKVSTSTIKLKNILIYISLSIFYFYILFYPYHTVPSFIFIIFLMTIYLFITCLFICQKCHYDKTSQNYIYPISFMIMQLYHLPVLSLHQDIPLKLIALIFLYGLIVKMIINVLGKKWALFLLLEYLIIFFLNNQMINISITLFNTLYWLYKLGQHNKIKRT